jgi:hypothetical protein
MPGPEHLRKLKSRRVVHKSTGGVLPRTPEPVDPVGNPPSAASFNTVAHPNPLPTGREGIRKNHIFSTIALPNSEHFSSFAPVIRRSKS